MEIIVSTFLLIFALGLLLTAIATCFVYRLKELKRIKIIENSKENNVKYETKTKVMSMDPFEQLWIKPEHLDA